VKSSAQLVLSIISIFWLSEWDVLARLVSPELTSVGVSLAMTAYEGPTHFSSVPIPYSST
jgi:hypothetical protein